MKRVCLFMLLIMAFMPFAAMSFGDSSPPGIEISVNYELSGEIDLMNLQNIDEARIAVFDCDLNKWPVNQIAINTLKNHYANSFIYKGRMNTSREINKILVISDQFAKPVNKHGIADKEVCYPVVI